MAWYGGGERTAVAVGNQLVARQQKGLVSSDHLVEVKSQRDVVTGISQVLQFLARGGNHFTVAPGLQRGYGTIRSISSDQQRDAPPIGAHGMV